MSIFLALTVESFVCVHVEVKLIGAPVLFALRNSSRFILAAFSTSVQPILSASSRCSFVSQQVFPPPVAPFSRQELITGAYETEMNESVKVWM